MVGASTPASAKTVTKCKVNTNNKMCVTTTSNAGSKFEEKYRTSFYNGGKSTASYTCKKSVSASSSMTVSTTATVSAKASYMGLFEASIEASSGRNVSRSMTTSYSHGPTVKVKPGYTAVCQFGFYKRKASGTYKGGWYSAGKAGTWSGHWTAYYPTEDQIRYSVRKGK